MNNPTELVPTEAQEQQWLFLWAAYNSASYPVLRKMYHIPNGGKRGKAEAARFKSEGVKAGIPDIHLPTARGGYHSLYIEMKRQRGGRLSPAQRERLVELEEEGNRVVVCNGWQKAATAIVEYLSLGD